MTLIVLGPDVCETFVFTAVFKELYMIGKMDVNASILVIFSSHFVVPFTRKFFFFFKCSRICLNSFLVGK